jgi:cell division protein FtsW
LLKLAALGILTTLGLQAVINLAVVTGLGPTKGIALPMLSSGGTGWILTAASLGLLVAMDRAHAVIPADGTESAYDLAADDEPTAPEIVVVTSPVHGATV